MKNSIKICEGVTFTPARKRTRDYVLSLLGTTPSRFLLVEYTAEATYDIIEVCSNEEYFRIYYSVPIIGEYDTYAEAEEAKQATIDDLRHWLLIVDEAAGSVTVAEYDGGPYQDYCRPFGSVWGEYDTLEKAEAAKQEVLDHWHCWLLIEYPAEGAAEVVEYIDGYMQQYTGPHGQATRYDTLEEARAALEKALAYYDRLRSETA